MRRVPELTPAQLEVFSVLQKNNMAWVALWVIFGAFVVVLIAFLAAVFWVKSDTAAKLSLAGIDGILGWSVKVIVSHLFPSKK
jgi:hypothetical protein